MNQKIAGIIAAMFAVGIATGLLGSILFASNGRPEVARISSTDPTGTVSNVTDATSTYQNSLYGFAVDFPSNLMVDEYDEGAGDRTIVFRKGSDYIGFQMFITQLTGPPLSVSDLQSSDPKMDLRTLTQATVGTSTPAFAFASDAPGVGPSRELWFSYGSYVFQVTTYPDQAAWLADIMRSWQPLE
jgi:hypothetical protein